jgi:hypothetical protein
MPDPSTSVKASLIDGDAEYPVELHLAGHFQPIDGRFHWGGRMTCGPEVHALLRAGRREVRLRREGAPEAVPARLAEPDPWGGIRVTGTGPPP